MNYDGNNSFLYVNVTKIYQFKAKNQQNKTKPVVPRKYFTINQKKIAVIKMKKKNRIKWIRVQFFVNYNIIDTSNTINIHNYLIKNTI